MPTFNDTTDRPPIAPEMVLCIPGPWPDRDAFFHAVMQGDGGYLMLGQSLLHVASSFSCDIEFQGPDPAIERAFGAAGPHWRNTPEMDAVARHRSVVYLIGPGGTPGAAEPMMRAAAALVTVGGLGVKIESSGLAHSPARWQALVANLELFSAHEALVVYVTGRNDTYSCGMHLLGLPDAITTGIDASANAELLRMFTRYLFCEAPTLHEAQTFAVEAGAPVYPLWRDQGIVYPTDSLFTNPYGYWRLKAVDESEQPPRTRWWH